jgi:DNA-binding NtrC family response regulator
MPAATLGKRVLFVDDEPSIRETLPLILQQQGYLVSVAATVAEAVEAVRSHTFDVLICDLNIERAGDGYTVVKAIREVDPRCIVIVHTGYPGLESALEGIRLGIDEYVIKPSDADALVALLAKKLASRTKARILSLSYDVPLLRTRHVLLEREGYEVVSTSNLTASLEECKQRKFDIFIVGQSIPPHDKAKAIGAFREVCQGPIFIEAGYC